MKKLEEFFKKKRLSKNFPNASSGHKLGTNEATHASTSSSSSSAAETEKIKKAAAEAAERRHAQQLERSKFKFPQRPPPEKVEEEEKKIYPQSEEMSNENDLYKFNCPALGIADYCSMANLKEKIFDKIKSNFGDDQIICGALLIRNCNPRVTSNECISTFQAILNNLETDDEAAFAKFSKLRKIKIENKILSTKGGIEFLTGIGFKLSEDGEWFKFDDSKDGLKEKLLYYHDVLRTSEVFPILLDRETRVYDLNALNTPNINFDDKIFEITKDELSREQQSRKEIAEQELTLMTKAMREKLITRKPKTDFTRVRYKRLDGIMIEATFKTRETLHDFIRWLKEDHCMEDIENYDLIHGTAPIPIEKWSETFLDLDLYPRVTFYQRLQS